MRGLARLAVLPAVIWLSGWLPGCTELQARTGPGLERGESVVSEELARLRAPGPFRYTDINRSRAVVVARGREVVLRPLEGLCLSQSSLEVGREAAFAVVTDCLAEAASNPDGDNLPPSFPGLLSVSVSGEPMFAGEDGRAAAIRDLRDFLGTAPGLAMLGRNGSGETVELVEARQVGDALYVHVRDSYGGELDLLAPDFWRAFVQLNGRLTMVTVSGFRDLALPSDTMLSLLAGQLAELRRANGGRSFEAELALAKGAGAALTSAALVRTDPSAGLGALREQIASRRPAPRLVPMPPQRPGSDPAPGDDTGTRHAPRQAPEAPLRPSFS